jgi:hypothetical protein
MVLDQHGKPLLIESILRRPLNWLTNFSDRSTTGGCNFWQIKADKEGNTDERWLVYRSVNATSKELKTGLNIYRIIDFEPVWMWA